ncbi:hypothetical protein, partial [Nonomuraea aridisoli]
MPKLKSLIAGIAIGTGMTGALVAGGASTATAATPATGLPVVMNDDFGDDVFDDDNNFSHFLPFLTHHNRGHKCGRGHRG